MGVFDFVAYGCRLLPQSAANTEESNPSKDGFLREVSFPETGMMTLVDH